MEATSAQTADYQKIASQYPLETDFQDPHLVKMYRAFLKGIIDHGQPAVLEKLDLRIVHDKYVCLSPFSSSFEAQGDRPTWEDAHFSTRIKDKALLTGVFDGHADEGKIAQFAANHFHYYFEKFYESSNYNIKKAFQSIINNIQNIVTANEKKMEQKGCTAAVTYVDLDTNLIVAATLGDTWVKLYRKTEQQEVVAISLSKKKDFQNAGEAKRVLDFIENNREKLTSEEKQYYKEKWHNLSGKQQRIWGGLNVSRALGDGWYKGRVIQSANISVFQVMPGDLVVTACDGVWDCVDDQSLIKNILKPNWNDDKIAEKIGQYALKESKYADNISVEATWMRPSKEGKPSYHDPSYGNTLSYEMNDESDANSTEEYFVDEDCFEKNDDMELSDL